MHTQEQMQNYAALTEMNPDELKLNYSGNWDLNHGW